MWLCVHLLPAQLNNPCHNDDKEGKELGVREQVLKKIVIVQKNTFHLYGGGPFEKIEEN